jgi:hypothetical protein
MAAGVVGKSGDAAWRLAFHWWQLHPQDAQQQRLVHVQRTPKGVSQIAKGDHTITAGIHSKTLA